MTADRDAASIADMLENARLARGLVEGKARDEVEAD